MNEYSYFIFISFCQWLKIVTDYKESIPKKSLGILGYNRLRMRGIEYAKR